MTKSFPLLFVLLWSSAFISGKIIVADGTPFASLGVRFIIVASGFGLVGLYLKDSFHVSKSELFYAIGTGVLFHGLYLGGVFFAQSEGMSAGLSALIVSLQPILTAVLAGPVLGERLTKWGWIGIALGFGGAALVIGIDVGNDIPAIGFIATIIALLAVSAGTLWTKKSPSNMPLSVSNCYQAIGAGLFHLVMVLGFEDAQITVTWPFILAMSWQIIAVSFGAFTILMILIKSGSASQTATLFFLVPPVSALMAWLVLDEFLTIQDIAGFCLASAGVYIATRRWARQS